MTVKNGNTDCWVTISIVSYEGPTQHDINTETQQYNTNKIRKSRNHLAILQQRWTNPRAVKIENDERSAIFEQDKTNLFSREQATV